mmetsp:Transcript_8353/g.12374  ORF Transcript_8353/g.12374 Transcript_8353/m.12374 type:complete len:231 (-) Transcript_8353:65-757(-)
MESMRSARDRLAAVLKGNYIYAFGGHDSRPLDSAERYSIADNSWENLPDLPSTRYGHSAVVLGKDVYLVGGYDNASLYVFDTASLLWKTAENEIAIPESIVSAAVIALTDRYVVVIGGVGFSSQRSCFIYDSMFNCLSETPVSMNMNEDRINHSATVLEGKVVVHGGSGRADCKYSTEYIKIQELLEYAPLFFPLPPFYFNKILILGKDGGSLTTRGNQNTSKRKRCDDE